MDLNAEQADKVAADIGGIALPCDVCDSEAVASALATAQQAHGVARIIVNFAGISKPAKIVGRKGPESLEQFNLSLQVNLVGTYNVMRLAAAALQQADTINADGERGVIISTASVAAFEGQIGQASYAASKAGVAALTLPAAREFAQFGIRVLAIAPGIFHTPMMDVLPAEAQESLGASIPFPSRLGKPEEFADTVLYMAGNTMLNGEVIRLDGAIRMAPK
jgi:NAD(P)-dependent dehydrogenase (short-subunit alcohol dehydrogenase family)